MEGPNEVLQHVRLSESIKQVVGRLTATMSRSTEYASRIPQFGVVIAFQYLIVFRDPLTPEGLVFERQT